MFPLKQLHTTFFLWAKTRAPDWQSEQMRRWGSGWGSFRDGADVNHFHHWFTRTQHALSASAPTPFIYPYSSTFLFGSIKRLAHTTTCTAWAHAYTRVHFSVELNPVGANMTGQACRESLFNSMETNGHKWYAEATFRQARKSGHFCKGTWEHKCQSQVHRTFAGTSRSKMSKWAHVSIQQDFGN